VKREISLFENDDVKLRALSAMYSLPVEEITASLLHQALLELEEKMPYVAGERVIRVEEGANIYEDVGPMARYLEAQKALRNGGAGERAGKSTNGCCFWSSARVSQMVSSSAEVAFFSPSSPRVACCSAAAMRRSTVWRHSARVASWRLSREPTPSSLALN